MNITITIILTILSYLILGTALFTIRDRIDHIESITVRSKSGDDSLRKLYLAKVLVILLIASVLVISCYHVVCLGVNK